MRDYTSLFTGWLSACVFVGLFFFSAPFMKPIPTVYLTRHGTEGVIRYRSKSPRFRSGVFFCTQPFYRSVVYLAAAEALRVSPINPARFCLLEVVEGGLR